MLGKIFGKSKSYIGVDIGTTSVKIVELKRVNGQPRLVNYSYSDEIADFSKDSNKLDVDKTAALINKMCKQSGIKSTNAITAMPSFAVFSSVLNLSAQANKKDNNLANAVMWEAKKVVPLDLDEMILDWKIIGAKPDKKKENKPVVDKAEPVDNSKKQTKVLLTGAPKTLVKNYIEIFIY